MFCSKCGAEAFGPYCANCGAKIESPKSVSENQARQAASKNNAKVNTKPSILLKSTSCKNSLSETEQKSTKLIKTIDTVIAIGCAVFFLLPYIIAILNDEKLESADPWPLPVLLLIFALLIAEVFYFSKEKKRITNIVGKYLGYCSKETLIVNEQGIYGSTMQGSVDLSYGQIYSVIFSTHIGIVNGLMAEPFCDILTIRDTAGKQYVFFSFTNCKELKSVIDMQLKDLRSVAANPTPNQQTAPTKANTKNADAPIQPQPTTNDEIICPACGTKQKSDRKVCWSCGTAFAPANTRGEIPAGAERMADGKWVCPKCGRTNAASRTTCWGCE